MLNHPVVHLSLEQTETLIAQALPRVKRVLGGERWWTLIRDFHALYYCCEPEPYRVAADVLDYLDSEHRGGKPGFPGFLADLVHFEWANLALAAAAAETLSAQWVCGAPLDVPLRIAPSVRVYAYDYPVHRITPECSSAAPAATFLIAQRQADGSIRWRETDAGAAAMLERIEATPGISGRQALQAAAARRGRPFAPVPAAAAARLGGMLGAGIVVIAGIEE